MNDRKKGWIKPVVLTLALATAGGLGVAVAKSDDWSRGGCERHGGYEHGKDFHGKAWFQSGRHTEGRLAFLKAELKINEDQEQAWNTFAGEVRRADEARAQMSQSRHESRLESRGERGRPGLDERIDTRLAAMEQHVALFRDLASAAKTLYGQLTPEQQEIADQLLPSGHHRRHMTF